MKKVFSVIICVFMVLSLSSCTVTNKQAEKDEREKYVSELNRLYATISQSRINDAEYSNAPWVQDRVQLPDSDIIVSLDKLRTVLYVYEIERLYSDEKQKKLSLTAEDIISLYSTPNEEKQTEFETLVEDMPYKKKMYYEFAYAAYKLYEKKFDKPFLEKEWELYSAEDTYNLVKWALGNVDYDYIDEIFASELNEYSSDTCIDYVYYLYHLGIIEFNYSRSKMVLEVTE